jgi:hypothetical protein
VEGGEGGGPFLPPSLTHSLTHIRKYVNSAWKMKQLNFDVPFQALGIIAIYLGIGLHRF